MVERLAEAHGDHGEEMMKYSSIKLHWKISTKARPSSSTALRMSFATIARAKVAKRVPRRRSAKPAKVEVGVERIFERLIMHTNDILGSKEVLMPAGPFVTQQTVICGTCSGDGQIFREKDKCKKCKGKKTTQEKKPLELYIPRGAKYVPSNSCSSMLLLSRRDGDKIILAGEADQLPDQEPGDIVFCLREKEHNEFTRQGADLSANITVTLAEALLGFSRPVIQHLDGRALSITHPAGSILKPLQVLKIPGEGMPYKKTDAKGDLFLIVEVKFPEGSELQDEDTRDQLKKLLPQPEPPITADAVDEVEFDADAKIEDFGTEGGTTNGGWEDDDDEGDEEGHGAHAQCAQQ